MALDLPRIAAALNAYPWTAGRLTERSRRGATYCAIGGLLRYAGVAQDHIACGEVDVLELYGPLLRAEYGLEEAMLEDIVIANDTATSQGEAIERVLGVLTGAVDVRTLMCRALSGGHPSCQPAAWEPGPDDGSGELALVG